MLKNLSFLNLLIWNIVIVSLWHLAVFLICIKMPASKFNPAKERYTAKSWEHGGRWYRENLKIHLWKDRLPQHIKKGGFSKKHLTDLSVDYLDEFIQETCRGEWMHLKNCICAVFVLLINPLLVGVITSLFILVGNLPFAVVQRYNRFRLQVLRKRRMREERASSMDPVVA